MNAILNWMSTATKLSAISLSDQIGADIICELSAKDGHIADSDDLFFHINHLDKDFALVQGISNYTLICIHTY